MINTDNTKEIRVGKRDTRKLIQEMNNFEWTGGHQKARKTGRILIDEERRISCVEWAFRYRHKPEDVKQADQEKLKKRRKHMLVISHWNDLGKIFREDVFYPRLFVFSHFFTCFCHQLINIFDKKINS